MSPPLRSMTGFARVRCPFADGELIVSVKSVNHRALDLIIQAPSALDSLESTIRTLVKAHVVRGHVEVRISIPKSSADGSTLALNRSFLHDYLKVFREEAAAHGLDPTADLNAVLRIPGMIMEAPEAGAPEGAESTLARVLEEALLELNTFRAREGAAIAADLRAHNAQVAASAQNMEQQRKGALESFQLRLTDRLRDIAKGIAFDPQRLAQEAAILADRSDIAEELTRLKIHSAQLGQLLDGGGEAGKKLDFLLQEMNRETNTILSKTNGAGDAALKIMELALGTKSAIEKIREQALNLE